MITNKNKFNKKYKQALDQPNSKKDMVRLTGIPKRLLDQVYYRGIGAYKTNPQSVRPHIKALGKGGADAWGFSRVYASINPKSKAYKIDKVHLKKKS